MTEPETPFDRYLRNVERTPDWQAKQASIRRVQGGYPLNPWKTAPYGLAVVAVMLVIGWWFGWPKG